MSVPKLNRALVLETPQQVPDGAGGFVQTWAPIGTCWAEVTARSGRQKAVAGASGSQVAYRIIVRAAPDGATERPAPDQRFREGARVYAIQAVSEHDPRGMYLMCYAQEAVIQ